MNGSGSADWPAAWPDEAGLRALELRAERAGAFLEAKAERHGELHRARVALQAWLELAPQAAETLERLSERLFGEVLAEIEANLSHALREILGQDREVKCESEFRAGRLNVDFHIENQGRAEDILHGQGGSVCNILSVGLRLIALSRLDESRHRPFLVLDEQDCWLKPELAPALMRLVKLIADRLGVQVLAISHHPLDYFSTVADRVYLVRPDKQSGGSPGGCKVELAAKSAE